MKDIAKQWVKQYGFTPDTKVVVGVSGGVDSMVLLSLLLAIPKHERPEITVAHINHQLRIESDEEEIFVKQFCQEHQLVCFSTKWEEGPSVTHSLEARARAFRYAYFEKILKDTQSSVLLTAHHAGDQVETVLMRLIQGSRLETLSGIRKVRPFGEARLIRPLLKQSKQELYQIAQVYHIPFREDVTNQHPTYFRNRIRNQIIPVLEEENPQFSEGMIRLSNDIYLKDAAMQELLQPIYQTSILQEGDVWQVDLDVFQTLSQAVAHQLHDKLCQDFHQQTGILIGHAKKDLLLSVMLSSASYKQVDLGQDWVGEKNYKKFKIMKKTPENVLKESFFLEASQGDYLSETEWIGLFNHQSPNIPIFDDTWCKEEMSYYHTKNHRIQIRKREDGDKFVYNQQGQTKKVSRFFIDEKIPMKKRQESWIIIDEKSNVLWVLPFRKSYLSIPSETDKIQYKLVYFKKKDR